MVAPEAGHRYAGSQVVASSPDRFIGEQEAIERARRQQTQRAASKTNHRQATAATNASKFPYSSAGYEEAPALDWLAEEPQSGAESTLRERAKSWLRTAMYVGLALIALQLLIYYWPIGSGSAPAGGQVEPKVAPDRPRPKFEGPLALNELLSGAERLFEGQFHAPESMAWTRDQSAFYSSVEGGFIIRVEPELERWFLVGRLNQRGAVLDESRLRPVEWMLDNSTSYQVETAKTGENQFVPFCDKDVRLYGPRAEFEPARVLLSRCSRPLGIRLAPDQSYLYISDPLSGLFRLDLTSDGLAARKVVRLASFGRRNTEPGVPVSSLDEVMFADDIAVRWSRAGQQSDLIYLTDCSRRWPLRHLISMMLEYDDSGRVLEFDVGKRRMRVLGSVVPLREDARNLSFPNGLELTADEEALLISDLNNRRILKHHLAGPKAGQSEHLLWVPGYADNIRRAPGLSADGLATYWAACGCAVDDGSWELMEFVNNYPGLRRFAIKSLHLLGALLGLLADLFDSTGLSDLALMVGAAWLRIDPYCNHGLVLHFDEQGRLLRSLHAPHFSSGFKLLSEAQQIRHANGSGSTLYLGSVYYSYLGRLQLDN